MGLGTPEPQPILPGFRGGTHFGITVDPTNANILYISGDAHKADANPVGDVTFGGAVFRGDASITRNPTVVPSPQWDHITHNIVPSYDAPGGTAHGTTPHADSRDLAFSADGTLLDANDGGIYRRTSPRDNTGDWYSLNGNLGTIEFHQIAYDSLSNTILGGTQDNGTPYQTAAGNTVWDFLSGGDGADVAVDTTSLAAQNQSVRYSSSQFLANFSKTIWNAAGSVVNFAFPALAVTGGGPALTAQFYTPIGLNHVAPSRILIGAENGLYESGDQGATLTYLTGSVIASGSTSHAIDFGATGNPDVAYVGGSDGKVYVRTTSGGSFTATSPPGGFYMLDVRMDPTDWQHAFALDSLDVFVTANAGTAWTNVTGDLFSVSGAQSLYSMAYIASSSALLVGTNTGVFASLASSLGTWFELGFGLPNALVADLDYDAADDILVAGTLGRSAWSLANASYYVTGAVGTTNVKIDATNLVVEDLSDVPDNLTIQSDNANNRFIIRESGHKIITDSTGGGTFLDSQTLAVPFSAVSGSQVIVNTLGADDSLTVDLALGKFSKQVEFDGGASGQGDTLVLTGNSATTGTFNYTATASGTVDFTGNAQIQFDSVESPLVSTVAATNVTTGFTSAAETLTVLPYDIAGGQTFLKSTTGQAVAFNTPTGLLTVNAGGGDDIINIDRFGGTFNGSLTVDGQGGTDTLNLNTNLSLTGGNVSLTADTIPLNRSITTTGSGTIAVTADRDLFVGFGVALTTVAGDLTLRANQGAVGVVGDFRGIQLNGATVSSADGDVAIAGRGGNSTSGDDFHSGVFFYNGTLVESTGAGAGAGKITVTGRGGDSDAFNRGVVMQDAATTVRSVDGAIQITGTGGDGTGAGNQGIGLFGGTIQSTGLATVSLDGFGGLGTDSNFGVYLSGSTVKITSAIGAIDLSGEGGDGSASFNLGVYLVSGATVESTNTATITIHGTGGSGTENNDGVQIDSMATSVKSLKGNISVTGIGGPATGSFSDGIGFFGGTIQSLGTGADAAKITLTGTAGVGTGTDAGIRMQGSAAKILSEKGDISLTGTGRGTGDGNSGVWILGGSLIESTGTGAASAKITLNGAGASAAGSNRGIEISDTATLIRSADGNVLLQGTGGAGSASFNHGLAIFGGTVRSTGAATLTVKGDATGGAGSNYGVQLNGSSAKITSATGAIVVEGNRAGGAILTTGDFNIGVGLYNGAIVESTGAGAGAATISISGKGGPSGVAGRGIEIATATTLVTAVDGSLTLIGDGASGAGSNHQGIIIFDGIVSSTGSGANAATISATGTGNSTAGFWLNSGNAKVLSTAGAVNISASTVGTASQEIVLFGPAPINAGSGALTLTADVMQLDGGAISGTGTLTIKPRTANTSIGVGATGSGTLNLSTTELANIANGFSTITIGAAAAGTGAVTVRSSTFNDPITVVGGTISVTQLNAGANNVTLTARTGAITDGGDASADIVGDAVSLSAAGAIGASGDSLTLAASSLVTNSTLGGANGNQFLREDDSITIGAGDLNAGSGTIALGPGTFVTTATGSIQSAASVESGGFLKGTGTTAAVTVASGGTVAPGASPGILNTGNTSFVSGATFAVEIGGTTPGNRATDHDQLNVTGTVSPNGATLSLSAFGGFTPSAGQSFVIIANDDTDTISTRFNGLLEGATITNFLGSGLTATITYAGGTGSNDVVLTLAAATTTDVVVSGGNLVITDANGGNTNDTLTITLFNPTTVRVTDPNNALAAGAGATQINANTVDVPLASITGNIQVNTLGGNDTLTVNLSGGDVIPAGGVAFNGGTGGDDALVVTGYSLNTADTTADVSVTHATSDSGTITLLGLGDITFDEIEPLTLSGTAADISITLPAGADSVTLGNDGGGQDTNGNTTNTSALYDSVAPFSFEFTEFANPTNSLTINRGSPADDITVLDQVTSGFTASLTIGGVGAEFDQVTFDGPVTLASGKNLSVNATGTISLPNTTSDLATSGTGAIGLTTARNISLASGSSITTVDGALSLSANALGTTNGNFHGVLLDGGLVQGTGSGNVTVFGTGGNAAGAIFGQMGVAVQGGGDVLGGSVGTLSVHGIGGASSDFGNYGVLVVGIGSSIGSSGAAVDIVGEGGGAASSSNHGVFVATSGVVSAGGLAIVTVDGTGGDGNGNSGVEVSGTITSSGGAVDVTAHGGGAAATSNSYGVVVHGSGIITSGGLGSVFVRGVGAASSGSDNHGVFVPSTGTITSGGGTVEVTGEAGGGGYAVILDNSGQITSGGSANLVIVADSVNVASTTASIRAGGTGTATARIRQRTTGTLINLGGADILTGSPLTLGLTDAELDRVTASRIVVGNASAGQVTFSAPIDLAGSNVLEVITSSSIIAGVAGTVFTDTSLALNAAANIRGQTLTAALEVAVSNLAATSGGAEGVNVTNTGNVNLTTVGDVTGVTANNGNVAIVASGSITVSQAVTATGGGALTLDAQSGDGGDLIINAALTNLGGSTILRADDDITAIAAGTLATSAVASSMTAGDDASGGGTINYGGNITLGASTLTIRLDDADGLVGGAISGAGGITKADGGTLALSGVNSYLGATTSGGGTLSVSLLADGGASSSLGASSNLAANLVLDGGTLAYTGPAISTDRLFSLGTGGGIIFAPFSGAINFTNTGSLGLVGSGSRTLQLDGSTNGSAIAAIIGDNGGATSLLLPSSSIWALTGTNTFSGPIDLRGGTLRVDDTDALGNGSSTNDLVIGVSGQASLQALGNVLSPASRDIVLAGVAIFDSNGFAISLGGVISGSGTLLKGGSGTLTLANSGNTFVGNIGTTTAGGTIAFASDGALGNAANDITINNLATLQATETVSLNSQRTLSIPAARTGTVEVAATKTLTLNGSLLLSGVGAAALNKTGAGTFTLAAAANTYTGRININAGRVNVNGTLPNSSAVDDVVVNSGGVLGGTGTIAGTVLVNSGGTVAPGASPGILATGDHTFAAGSTFEVEIGGPAPGNTATDHDQLVVTGSVTISSTAPGVTLSLSGSYVPSASDVFVLIKNDDTDPIGGTFASRPEGTIVNINGVNKRLTYAYNADGGSVANDVALVPAGTLSASLSSGSLTVADVDATGIHNNLTLKLVNISGTDYLEITDATEQFTSVPSTTPPSTLTNGNKTLRIPASAVTGSVTFNTAGGDDSLTVDFSGGNPLPAGGIDFAGGTGGNDSLIVTGGSTTSVTHTFTNVTDGSVTLAGVLAGAIRYTGLDPITDNLNAADRTFTFTGGVETISLTDAALANMTISSNLSESVTFANPTNSLTINAGIGNDTINITSLDGAYAGALAIHGDADTDTITLSAGLPTLSALTITSETIAPLPALTVGAGG